MSLGPKRTRGHGEDGQAGGAEAVALGLLVFVVGVLVVANAWAVVDAKMAMSAAAGQAARAFVEARPGTDPMVEAQSAAREAVRGYGRDPDRMVLRLVEGRFARCELVRFEASYRVPAVSVPWLGGTGEGFTATSRHARIVDPYRDGVPGEQSSECRP